MRQLCTIIMIALLIGCSEKEPTVNVQSDKDLATQQGIDEAIEDIQSGHLRLRIQQAGSITPDEYWMEAITRELGVTFEPYIGDIITDDHRLKVMNAYNQTMYKEFEKKFGKGRFDQISKQAREESIQLRAIEEQSRKYMKLLENKLHQLEQSQPNPNTLTATKTFRHTQKLLTPHYIVTISDNSQEGDVAYDGVQYHGVSRTTGKSITLMGSTYHLHDKQGTPTRFLGYRFVNGDTTYDVLEIDERPRLIVHQNNHTIIDEHGDWVKE